MKTRPHLPEVVSRDAWPAARKALPAKEKALTHERDRVNADRRRLPRVRLDKAYVFEGPAGRVGLADGDAVFHTYSTYARGCDLLLGTYNWLDLTALGRQEDWELPKGRSDGPFMAWLRHHDRYHEGERHEVPVPDLR